MVQQDWLAFQPSEFVGGPGVGHVDGVMAVVVLAVLVFVALSAASLVLVTRRAGPDPEGRRTDAVYLAAVAFVSVYTALFAAFGLTLALTSLLNSPRTFAPPVLGSEPESVHVLTPVSPVTTIEGGTLPGGGLSTTTTTESAAQVFAQLRGTPESEAFLVAVPSRADQATTEAVASGLVVIVMLGVLALHRRRLRAVLSETAYEPTVQVMRTYRLVVSFFAVFVAAIGLVLVLFGLYRVIAPGVAGLSDRCDGLQELISFAALSAGAAWILRMHRLPPTPDPHPES